VRRVISIPQQVLELHKERTVCLSHVIGHEQLIANSIVLSNMTRAHSLIQCTSSGSSRSWRLIRSSRSVSAYLILPLPHSDPQLRTSETVFSGSGSAAVKKEGCPLLGADRQDLDGRVVHPAVVLVADDDALAATDDLVPALIPANDHAGLAEPGRHLHLNPFAAPADDR